MRQLRGITKPGHVGVREAPECLVLGVREGVTPSAAPPVRIYLGTEPRQYRATRVFVWSIEQVRDPARVYEIYLMTDLAGFNRFGWLTGFTNYRFAIPHFAGRAGRAIYNDVDQVYLADPAELFDQEMAGHGVLTVAPEGRLDSSVMLIDCARMAEVWPLRDAQRRRKNHLLKKAKAVPGLVGVLDPAWNARDDEYRAGGSKVLHYTALHSQPWRPFPERFVYQDRPESAVWHELRRGADAAGYNIHRLDSPGAAYGDTVERLRRSPRPASGPWDEATRGLLAKVQARSVLEYGLGALGGAEEDEDRLAVTRHDPAVAGLEAPPADGFDAVLCRGGLNLLADGDVAWVLDELFARAARLVCLDLDVRGGDPAPVDGSPPPGPARDPSWWYAQLAECGRRYPEVHWRVALGSGEGGARRPIGAREGGPDLDGPPTVWVLTDAKPGHTTQSVGLAEALGWPYEIKTLEFNAWAGIGNLLPGRLGATRIGLTAAAKATVTPPWPDVVIATGWRPAPITRWIALQGHGAVRTVQLGRKGGRLADHYDVVISSDYCRLPAHPRRIETAAPLNRASPERLAEAADGAATPFGDMPRPHVALLVGGTSRRHRLAAEAAGRMGAEVAAFAEAAGGSVYAVTSRRTGEAAADALSAGLGPGARVWRWGRDESANPYIACLARADVLVVTGDSESMLAEAAASGKPTYIYPVAEKPPGLWTRVEIMVEAGANARPLNRRGTTRPQSGLERLCALLLAHGLVQPRRDLTLLHRHLVARGIAHLFGEPLDLTPRAPLREAEQTAVAVRRLLGYPEPPADRPSPKLMDAPPRPARAAAGG